MKHTPKPGAYRELFKSGLIALLRTGELSEQERKDAVHYLLLLDNPNYKFGSLQPTNSMGQWLRFLLEPDNVSNHHFSGCR